MRRLLKINVYMTEEEKRALVAAAKETRRSLTNFVMKASMAEVSRLRHKRTQKRPKDQIQAVGNVAEEVLKHDRRETGQRRVVV